MSHPTTFEAKQLSQAEARIYSAVTTYPERIRLLESVAALNSGFDLKSFYEKCYPEECVWADESVSKEVLSLILKSGVPVEYAICSLIREPLTIEEKKKNGVYYTDYRLAELINKSVLKTITKKSRVADLAAGTGILIISAARAYKKKYEEVFDKWISKSLFAFDLSEYALRGASAAIISMSKDVSSVLSMISNWKACDSLLDLPDNLPPFDIIVGNPPWGRIKLSIPTYLSNIGSKPIYGSSYPDFDESKFFKEKDKIAAYSKKIKATYNLLKNAEPDTYMAFLQCAINNLKDGGKLSFIIPGGIIRSENTFPLRSYLIENGCKLSIRLLDNKPSFFSIDSRFKFVIIDYSPCVKKKPVKTIQFLNSTLCDNLEGKSVLILVKSLKFIRPDLTLPEIRTKEELSLFVKLYKMGIVISKLSGEWDPDYSREVDMTSDKHLFLHDNEQGSLPIVEGRMVQQYRFGAKEYVSGEGRSAVWKPSLGNVVPQYYVLSSKLKENIVNRANMYRLGYCDIAGQTNERAMMSAIIPPGVVCGNKVPTISFPSDSKGDMIYFWMGVMNSFVFDWMIRRIVSTTVNYFHIESLPFPKISSDSKDYVYIVSRAKKLCNMGPEYYNGKEMEKIRSEIEVKVAQLYGVTYSEFVSISGDFPLVDKRQPRISGEPTVSFNKILLALAKKESQKRHHADIDNEYKLKGASAFIPSEMTILSR